jgi:hypothetical protein
MTEEMMNANQAKTDVNLKEIREEIQSGQAEMRSIVNVWMADMNKDGKKTTSCKVMTVACLDIQELNPEDMESEVEHREVPKENVVVKPFKGRKKRHWGQHLVAGRRGETKELNQGECGSRRKLASACRKMSHRAAVARRKRNIFRKIRTQGNCGPRKELDAAGRKMTRSAKVAQCKGRGLQGRSHEAPSVEKGRRKNQTRNKFARETRKGRTFGRRELMSREGTSRSSYGLKARGQPAGATGRPSGWRP